MDKRYQIDTKENKKWLRELLDEILEFAKEGQAPDGSTYYQTDEGKPWLEKNRDTYETCRMAHSYAIAYALGYEGAKEKIENSIKALKTVMYDEKNGGFYAGLTADNKPISGKLCYTHAFVILAATSAMIAGVKEAKELLDEALTVYDKYFWEEEYGLAADNWNTEFTELDTYRGINANMHSVEAFLAVADVTGLEKYRIRSGRMIEHVLEWAENNNWRIPEHFTDKWEPELELNKEKKDDGFKPYGATPGHGLEWSRLIIQWAMSTFKDDVKKIEKYINYAEKLFCRAIEDGWNSDGQKGIVYTTDWEGNPIVHDRMHWALCEGINTAAVLWKLTKKQKYADYYEEFLKYADEKVIDHVNGSWFHQLDRENNVIGTVWPGKNDIYHAVQATVIPIYGAEQSIVPAIINMR